MGASLRIVSSWMRTCSPMPVPRLDDARDDRIAELAAALQDGLRGEPVPVGRQPGGDEPAEVPLLSSLP
jgi:hypothetical protein